MKKLYILFIAFIGVIGNAQISYPSPVCVNYAGPVTPVFSPGFTPGGIFSSSAGLVIDPVTGVINPTVSTPGSYVVTYSVSASPPDNPAQFVTFVITILPAITPTFDAIAPVCSGNSTPVLPSVSNNGISGSWTPAIVNTQQSATYTFTPNEGECATSTSMVIIVLQSAAVPVVTTSSGSSTVYVDGSNAVVAPLTLTCETSPGYTYQWFEDGVLILNATANTYTINTASVNALDRIFTVEMTNISTGCSSMSTGFVVTQSSGVPPPIAPRFQSFASGASLTDVVVSGTGIQWYDSSTNRNSTSTPLPLNTLLVDATTYYASQTQNGIESLERFPVTVSLILGVGGSELVSLSYSPNPVRNRLTIKSTETINNISVINLLGQVLKTTNYNQAEIVEDMSGFTNGTYFIRVLSGSKTEVFKIIKG